MTRTCLHFAPMVGARPGELPEEDARALAEHLAGCDACQGRLADAEVVSALLPEALLAEAARRDFSTFSDEVLARLPARLPSPEERGAFARLRAWVGRHRQATAAAALAPALAVAALIVYLRAEPEAEPPAFVEVSSEGDSATILETTDGPVVLLGEGEPEGS